MKYKKLGKIIENIKKWLHENRIFIILAMIVAMLMIIMHIMICLCKSLLSLYKRFYKSITKKN